MRPATVGPHGLDDQAHALLFSELKVVYRTDARAADEQPYLPRRSTFAAHEAWVQ